MEMVENWKTKRYAKDDTDHTRHACHSMLESPNTVYSISCGIDNVPKHTKYSQLTFSNKQRETEEKIIK